MLSIPLAAVPAQSFNVTLDGQAVSLALYTLADGSLNMDVVLAGVPIKTCLACHNLMPVLTFTQYTGFVGDFVFVDTQGSSDPTADGLGDRYQLVYLEAADL